MAIGGFPIIATSQGPRAANDLWFVESHNGTLTQDGVTGDVKFTADDSTLDFSGVSNTDPLVIVSDDINKTYNQTTTAKGAGSGNVINTNATYTSDQTGTIYILNNINSILWDSDTPQNFLRIIHVQFDIIPNTTSKIEVTFDNGVIWMPVLNNEDFQGVGTFTFFITKNTQLNFRGTGALDDMGIIVSSPR